MVSAMAACNNATDHAGHRADGYSHKPENAEDSLFQLVMDGHDVAMGKMGKIKGFQEQAKKALDSIAKLPAGAARNQLEQAYKSVQEDLNYSVFSMDSWMEAFEPDSAKDDNAKRLEYLQSEADKVGKLKTGILATLARADSLMGVK